MGAWISGFAIVVLESRRKPNQVLRSRHVAHVGDTAYNAAAVFAMHARIQVLAVSGDETGQHDDCSQEGGAGGR